MTHSAMCEPFKAVIVAPLFIAGWALVAGAVVVRSFIKRDKQRQQEGGKVLPPDYITETRGRHDGRKIHDCPRHGGSAGSP